MPWAADTTEAGRWTTKTLIIIRWRLQSNWGRSITDCWVQSVNLMRFFKGGGCPATPTLAPHTCDLKPFKGRESQRCGGWICRWGLGGWYPSLSDPPGLLLLLFNKTAAPELHTSLTSPPKPLIYSTNTQSKFCLQTLTTWILLDVTAGFLGTVPLRC